MLEKEKQIKEQKSMQIKPTTAVINAWIADYIPEKDLFFLTEEQYKKLTNTFAVIAMPIDEFFNHNTYSQIHYMNSYEYWNIKHAQYVVIAESSWIEQLSNAERKFILAAQLQCGRGMTVPLSFIHNSQDVPVDYIHDGNVILQSAMWKKLSPLTKGQLLEKMVYEWWDKGECKEIPEDSPIFLRKFANTFSTIQGANCLAAVLYAVTEGKFAWIIEEWIHQNTFLEKLKQFNYQNTQIRTLLKGDVVVWQDTNGVIQHAAYCIGEDLFFNKHGQTVFNPWKILSKVQLDKEWNQLNMLTYRKVQ